MSKKIGEITTKDSIETIYVDHRDGAKFRSAMLEFEEKYGTKALINMTRNALHTFSIPQSIHDDRKYMLSGIADTMLYKAEENYFMIIEEVDND